MSMTHKVVPPLTWCHQDVTLAQMLTLRLRRCHHGSSGAMMPKVVLSRVRWCHYCLCGNWYHHGLEYVDMALMLLTLLYNVKMGK